MNKKLQKKQIRHATYVTLTEWEYRQILEEKRVTGNSFQKILKTCFFEGIKQRKFLEQNYIKIKE